MKKDMEGRREDMEGRREDMEGRREGGHVHVYVYECVCVVSPRLDSLHLDTVFPLYLLP